MSAPVPSRPLPLPDEITAPFWEACRRHELRMQRCTACSCFRFPPRLLCPHCLCASPEWVALTGDAVVFSFVICHPPVLPAFQASAPFAVALVELAEDPLLRMLGNVLDAPPESLRIGQRLRVAFEEIAEGVVLPQWRLAP